MGARDRTGRRRRRSGGDVRLARDPRGESRKPGGSINFSNPEESRHLSRIPRSSLFYFFLIVILGFVFWFTWQQFEGSSKGDQWSYSKLVNSAQAGQVKSVDIKGNDATATAHDGTRHDVHLPDDTSALAAELAKDNVDVNYEQAGSG